MKKSYTTFEVLALLRNKLDRSGMSQREAARQVGISESYLCDQLAGRRSPGPELLGLIGLQKQVRYVRQE